MTPLPPKSAIEDLRLIRQRCLAREIKGLANLVAKSPNTFKASSVIYPSIVAQLRSIARRILLNDFDFKANWNPDTKDFKIEFFARPQ